MHFATIIPKYATAAAAASDAIDSTRLGSSRLDSARWKILLAVQNNKTEPKPVSPATFMLCSWVKHQTAHKPKPMFNLSNPFHSIHPSIPFHRNYLAYALLCLAWQDAIKLLLTHSLIPFTLTHTMIIYFHCKSMKKYNFQFLRSLARSFVRFFP